MSKYAIGIDFGTLSGRALLVDISTGKEIAVSVMDYPHGVMDSELTGGKKLPQNYALQHPQDYIDVIKKTVPEITKNINHSDIVGIGIDFTSSTVMPVRNGNIPLCFDEKYKDEPHSYVKLWKHHAAQKQAEKFLKVAKERNEKWLIRYGSQISSEWLFPKLLEIAEESPLIYETMDEFIEAGDWITRILTDSDAKSSCHAGYKAFWSKNDGYPSNEYFKAVSPLLDGVIGSKIRGEIVPGGNKVGVLNKYGAEITGLTEGIPLAAPSIDAHIALPATGITGAGELLMIMGTSTCHIMMSNEEKSVPGISGVVEDGVCEGYFGYEAGQACVGDMFGWFVNNCVPYSYAQNAEKEGKNIHKYLREKAKKLKIGESGLIALDWWNGNRSILSDSNLSGMLLGLKLTTTPEEIYRALIESTAFGTKIIMDTYEENGVEISSLYAAGGIAEKDEMAMQIYADVTNKEIKISGSKQACALGSAIFGAVAGSAFDSVKEAAEVMSNVKDTVYRPIPENVQAYSKLFEEYKTLHDYFGRGGNDVMKKLMKF